MWKLPGRRPTRSDHTVSIVVCGIGGGGRVSGDRRRTSFDSSGSGTDDSFVLRPKLGLFHIATVANVEAVASFFGTARAAVPQVPRQFREDFRK